MRRFLGASGLAIRPIGLGGMALSLRRRPPEEEAVRLIHAALDAGMDFIDTADAYCLDEGDVGHNERLLARALRERPGEPVVIATKGGMERPSGRWLVNGRPDYLKRCCEASLQALDVEVITLYQLHRPDLRVPFSDSVGALAELREAGKILHVGLSNVSVAQIEVARQIVPIVSVQNRCHPYDRSAWQDGVIRYCEENAIAFLAYSPVGGMRDRDLVAQDPVLTEIGRAHGVSPQQVALAWLLAASPVLVAIPGATRLTSVLGSAAAMDLVLTADRESLERAFPTRPP
jgi:aryl-alcohol dehydrogenase-like predicted oxidoreductase